MYKVIKREISKNISPIIIISILFNANPKRYIESVNSCAVVLILAIKVTLVASVIPFLAFKSLRAPTQISLVIIIAPINPIK